MQIVINSFKLQFVGIRMTNIRKPIHKKQQQQHKGKQEQEDPHQQRKQYDSRFAPSQWETSLQNKRRLSLAERKPRINTDWYEIVSNIVEYFLHTRKQSTSRKNGLAMNMKLRNPCPRG